MQVVRYLRRWISAEKVSPKGRGGWLFLFAFCFCLGFLLALLPALGVIVALSLPDAELAKSTASLFCVSAGVKNALDR